MQKKKNGPQEKNILGMLHWDEYQHLNKLNGIQQNFRRYTESFIRE